MRRWIAAGTRALNADGVVGDPRLAKAERGARYLAAQTACFEAALADWLVAEATPPTGSARA